MIVFAFVRVALYAGACGSNVGMGVGVNVDAAIDVGPAPWTGVDGDGVAAPTEACPIPAEAAEWRSDGDGRAEVDGAANEESWARREEDDARAIDGDIVEGRVDGLDFDVAVVVDDVVVGVGGEVAVASGRAAHALYGVHYIGLLVEDGVAERAGPLGITRHHVEHGGEGQEGKDTGVPGEIVGLDGLGEGVAVEVIV